MTAQDLWPRLAGVRRFQITVLSPDLQLRNRGIGAIRTTSSGASTLVWQETGRWLVGPLAGIPFRNTTAWRLEAPAPALHLSHLRQGPERPTFLATLRPRPSGVWAADAPHACGQDLYLPTLDWWGEGLRLEWEVRSPTDPYALHFEAC